MESKSKFCGRGLYDPPYALHGVAAAATPTPSDFAPSTAPISPAPAARTTILPARTPSPSSGDNPSSGSDPSSGGDPSNEGSVSAGNGSGNDIPSDAGSTEGSSGEGSSGRPSSNNPGSSSSEDDPGSGDPDNGDASPPPSDPPPSDPASPLNNPGGAIVAALGVGEGRDPPGLGYSNADSNAGGEIAAILSTGSDDEGSHGQPIDPARNGEGNPHGTAFDPTGDGSGNGDVAQEGSILGVIGGQTISKDPKDPVSAIIGSNRLFVGGPAMTVSGRVISMASSGLVVDGVAPQFSGIPGAILAPTDLEASFTISGKAYTVYEDPKHPDLAVIVAASGIETRLTMGGTAITIDSRKIYLNSAGIMVGSSEAPFHTVSVHGLPEEQAFFTDARGHVHTIVVGSTEDVAIVDGSAILIKGSPPLTIDGDFVTWGSDGLFVDNTRVAFQSATATGWRNSALETTKKANGPSMPGATSGPLPSETRVLAANPSSSKKVLAFDSTPLLVLWSLVLVVIYVL